MANMQTEGNSKQQFWSGRGAFILAAVGSAVGLGNIWRYPATVFNNGGGAFFIPYFIAFFTAGLPMLILEFTIGSKYRGSGPLAYARISPKWEFLGWIPTMVAGMIIFFYMVILAWAANFMGFAFSGMSWGADPTDFFMNEFLGATGSPLILGGVNWSVVLALLVLYGITYVVSSNDLKSGLEKFNKVLLPAMFISIVGLMVYALTLPGAWSGLDALFTPNWGELTNPQIWIAAYGQIFFSMSVCMGIMIAYGSYLPKKTDIVTTSLTIGFADIAVSMFAATAVFALLGYMATAQGVAVSEVSAAGAGLVFMVFPVAFNLMGPVGPWFGGFFFIAILIAGMTSFVSLMEAFSQPFVEKYNMDRKKIFAITTVVGFLASSLYATGAGIHLLTVVNYVLDYFLMIGGFLQVVACVWLYKKYPEFQAYLNPHGAIKLGSWWLIPIKFVFPVIVLVIVGTWIMDFLGGGAQAFPTEVLIFVHGGTAAIIIVASIVLSFIRWRSNIELKEE